MLHTLTDPVQNKKDAETSPPLHLQVILSLSRR